MDEIYWFIVTTYLLAGLFQGIIVAVREIRNDVFSAPSEINICIIVFGVGWPVFQTVEFIDYIQKPTNQ